MAKISTASDAAHFNSCRSGNAERLKTRASGRRAQGTAGRVPCRTRSCEPLFPNRRREKLLAQVALYWDGLRPDLGIHGAVHYLFRVLRGDVRVGSQTEEEKLEEISLRGGEAGAIFALCLGPFLAFFVGVLWGIYATQYGVQRNTRLLMGAIFGGATAKVVAVLMSLLGGYTDNLWYFIMALAIPLGVIWQLDGILDGRRLARHPARQRTEAQARRQYGNLIWDEWLCAETCVR